MNDQHIYVKLGKTQGKYNATISLAGAKHTSWFFFTKFTLPKLDQFRLIYRLAVGTLYSVGLRLANKKLEKWFLVRLYRCLMHVLFYEILTEVHKRRIDK